MTRPMFSHQRKIVLPKIEYVISIADQIQVQEDELVHLLYEIDQKKIYVYCGFKSLMSFCIQTLRFSKTQSQRIVTRVRRYEPTLKIGKKNETERDRQSQQTAINLQRYEPRANIRSKNEIHADSGIEYFN